MRVLVAFIWMIASNAAFPTRIILKSNHRSHHVFPRSRNHPSNDDKIVGGDIVKAITEYPYMIAILIDGIHNCGGGVLTLSFVLTACHCLADIPTDGPGPAEHREYLAVDAYDFVAGTVNLKVYEQTVQIRKAESLYFHPKCQNTESLVYDLGLARMFKPFVETPQVKPLKMLSWDRVTLTNQIYGMFNGTSDPKCVVAGWGEYRRGEFNITISHDILKAVQMHVISNEECFAAYSDMLPDKFSAHNFTAFGQICTLSQNSNASDCAGDSGGPYVCDGYIIGVVSYGVECGSEDPNVYQTVSILADWVKKQFHGAFAFEGDKTKRTMPPNAGVDAYEDSRNRKKNKKLPLNSAINQQNKYRDLLRIIVLQNMREIVKTIV